MLQRAQILMYAKCKFTMIAQRELHCMTTKCWYYLDKWI